MVSIIKMQTSRQTPRQAPRPAQARGPQLGRPQMHGKVPMRGKPARRSRFSRQVQADKLAKPLVTRQRATRGDPLDEQLKSFLSRPHKPTGPDSALSTLRAGVLYYSTLSFNGYDCSDRYDGEIAQLTRAIGEFKRNKSCTVGGQIVRS